MTDLVTYQDRTLSTYDDIERAAKAMAGSGFFSDTRQASQAIVKIMAGRELGVGPFASMTGVNIIQGKPAFGANIMAACVKKSGRYSYRVTEMTDRNCTIEFMEKLDGKWLTSGISSFSLDDAKRAGTKNLDKFPRNMLFARAISNGVRWFCPEVMNGTTAYTPEELGVEVDQEGNVIDVVGITSEETPRKYSPTKQTQESTPKTDENTEYTQEIEQFPEDTNNPAGRDELTNLQSSEMTYEEACAVTNSRGQNYGDLDANILKFMARSLNKALDGAGLSPTDQADYQRKLAAIDVIVKNRL